MQPRTTLNGKYSYYGMIMFLLLFALSTTSAFFASNGARRENFRERLQPEERRVGQTFNKAMLYGRDALLDARDARFAERDTRIAITGDRAFGDRHAYETRRFRDVRNREDRSQRVTRDDQRRSMERRETVNERRHSEDLQRQKHLDRQFERENRHHLIQLRERRDRDEHRHVQRERREDNNLRKAFRDRREHDIRKRDNRIHFRASTEGREVNTVRMFVKGDVNRQMERYSGERIAEARENRNVRDILLAPVKKQEQTQEWSSNATTVAKLLLLVALIAQLTYKTDNKRINKVRGFFANIKEKVL